ncbi:hypothetical protein GH825_28635 [Bacillus thuringiensis]|nr:hypothetical protein [Bacillus thuringiensis]
MYTSGWPKNQNRCWYRTGSPPPAGSKKDVFKFRSVRSIVSPPARTGIERRRRTAVSFTLQTNKGTRSNRRPLYRIFITVVIKLIEARIEDTPDKWRAKIAKSMHGPAWAILEARGG